MLYQSTDGYSELDRRGDTPPELEHQEEAEAVLSRRELEILKLMGQGFSQKEIAKLGQVTVSTVKFHCSNLYKKLGVTNRQNAILQGIKRGLIEPTK